MRSLQFGVLAGYTFSHLATMYEQNDGREAVSLVITNHSRFTVRDDAPDTRPSWSSLVGEISYIVSRERHVCDNIGTPIGRRVRDGKDVEIPFFSFSPMGWLPINASKARHRDVGAPLSRGAPEPAFSSVVDRSRQDVSPHENHTRNVNSLPDSLLADPDESGSHSRRGYRFSQDHSSLVGIRTCRVITISCRRR